MTGWKLAESLLAEREKKRENGAGVSQTPSGHRRILMHALLHAAATLNTCHGSVHFASRWALLLPLL